VVVDVLGKEDHRRLEDVRPSEKVHRLVTLIFTIRNLSSQDPKEAYSGTRDDESWKALTQIITIRISHGLQ
jgi:hypothetical protein